MDINIRSKIFVAFNFLLFNLTAAFILLLVEGFEPLSAFVIGFIVSFSAALGVYFSNSYKKTFLAVTLWFLVPLVVGILYYGMPSGEQGLVFFLYPIYWILGVILSFVNVRIARWLSSRNQPMV